MDDCRGHRGDVENCCIPKCRGHCGTAREGREFGTGCRGCSLKGRRGLPEKRYKVNRMGCMVCCADAHNVYCAGV